MIHIPILELEPAWVEFTATKGVLRVLSPKESKEQRHRAQGMVFKCPRCMAKSKTKQAHYCIFLFENAPTGAKPLPRFMPSLWFKDLNANGEEPVDFQHMTLTQNSDCPSKKDSYHLVPGDLKCRWEGELSEGVVSWKPSMLENFSLWR